MLFRFFFPNILSFSHVLDNKQTVYPFFHEWEGRRARTHTNVSFLLSLEVKGIALQTDKVAYCASFVHPMANYINISTEIVLSGRVYYAMRWGTVRCY